MARNNKAANKRRATQTWDKDPTRPGAPSALEVLMTWLTAPGNAERWRRENRKELSNEIIQKLHTHGIYDREPSDVQYKIRIMEHNFSSATALLSQNKQVDAFQRGEADHKIVAQVVKLCPQYRQLLQVFGKNSKNPQVTTNCAVNGVAGNDKKNDTSSGAAGGKGAAGEWKKSLENNGHGRVIAEETKGGEEKMLSKKEQWIGDGKANAKQPNGAEKGATGNTGTVASLPEQSVVDAAANVIVDVAIGGAQVNVRHEETGKDQAVSEDVATVEMAVDEGQSGDGAEKGPGGQQEKETDNAQVSSSDSDENSEEEEKPRTRVAVKTGVRSPFKTKPKESESEDSSSSEEENNEDKDESDSESEQEETDEEERIPLAQADEVEPTPTGNEEGQTSVDEAETAKVEETSSSEEEADLEEEPDQSDLKKADSSSSESSNENSDTEEEEEVPPTQVKAPSQEEDEEESEKYDDDENENDVEMEEEEEVTENTIEHTDSGAQRPAEQRETNVQKLEELSDADEKPTKQSGTERSTRKRNNSTDSSQIKKQTRRDDEAKEATRDLERKAFIERAKQERDQRETLFNLERAKLECELQAKQVQLAMERSLARKKLLGAGIDPAEVDRVLPL
ncbi:hypothetical protein DVH05_004502 [Phytophthora capsici]|nr:hypothetical protein DVH05_004502 [Phytophthora capsici]